MEVYVRFFEKLVKNVGRGIKGLNNAIGNNSIHFSNLAMAELVNEGGVNG
jgi:hypothetical protein